MTTLLRIALLLLAFSTQAAMACSCAPPPPTLKTDNAWLEWRLDGISAVFEGKVENIQFSGWPIKPKPVAGETIQARDPLKVTFSAVHVYRGEASGEVTIETGLGLGDCGFEFEKGSRYLVFARKDDTGNLTTSICTGTSLLKDAGQNLKLLGIPPALPEEADDAQQDIDDSNHQICGHVSRTSKEKLDAGQVMAWRVEDDDIAAFAPLRRISNPTGDIALTNCRQASM